MSSTIFSTNAQIPRNAAADQALRDAAYNARVSGASNVKYSVETPEAATKRKKANAACAANKRAAETPEATTKRNSAKANNTAEKKAGETPEATTERKMAKAAGVAVKRAAETPEATTKRKSAKAIYAADKRAAETPEATSKSKNNDADRLYLKRKDINSENDMGDVDGAGDPISLQVLTT
jgi:hypothetical protein